MSNASASAGDKPALVLFRHDLRIADNEALTAAVASGKPVLALFVRDDESPGGRPIGGARRWWLHHSLASLARSLAELGITLHLRAGPMLSVVASAVDESGADLVLWNRRYDPFGREADAEMKAALIGDGVTCVSHEGYLLQEPWRVATGSGGPYKVFTPFWNAVAATPVRAPLPAPIGPIRPGPAIATERLDDWRLLPTSPDWAEEFSAHWLPGEPGARDKLARFRQSGQGYALDRDRPDVDGTSMLSPHLAHGEITPAQIFAALGRETGVDMATFRKEVGWREFCWHLLFHFPDLGRAPFNRTFRNFPWRDDRIAVAAWQRGQTGYPIVDAGMRQLWRTGWMHNRVRMIVASFLTKHLLVDWRDGEDWFWDTLVDADPASNPANWQWVAGSGADAAPYFRIFNPILQGEKFDPAGAYVRQYVPELTKLPDRFIHKPWEAPETTLFSANVKLGQSYPVSLIDHKAARQRALEAYQAMRGTDDD